MSAEIISFPDPKTVWRLDFTIPVDVPLRIKKTKDWNMEINRGYGTAFIPGSSRTVAVRELLESIPDAMIVEGRA
jgi:hypothetical protein